MNLLLKRTNVAPSARASNPSFPAALHRLPHPSLHPPLKARSLLRLPSIGSTAVLFKRALVSMRQPSRSLPPRSRPPEWCSQSWSALLPNKRYQLIAGERRWLASKLAGKESIPAILRNISDEQAMEITIVENLQRADLNPIEQARAYDRLSREFKMTQESMAQRTGKDRASVANFLRLLRLPAETQNKVESGELSFGHARALLALDSPEAILKRDTEGHRAFDVGAPNRKLRARPSSSGREEASGEEKAKEPLDPNVREARDLLQRALGLKVRIEDKNGRGRVIIEYGAWKTSTRCCNAIAPK